MPCKAINNKSGLNLDQHQEMLNSFFPYTQEKLGYDQDFSLNLLSDQSNSEKPLGKTAYYDPEAYEITIYVDGRHIKDIMRSMSHELVHHSQNCRGEFKGGIKTDDGYAQQDGHLRSMEKEAYLQGNMLFRDWEDNYKRDNSLKESKLMDTNTLRQLVTEQMQKVEELRTDRFGGRARSIEKGFEDEKRELPSDFEGDTRRWQVKEPGQPASVGRAGPPEGVLQKTGKELFGRNARLPDAVYTKEGTRYFIYHDGKKIPANRRQRAQLEKAFSAPDGGRLAQAAKSTGKGPVASDFGADHGKADYRGPSIEKSVAKGAGGAQPAGIGRDRPSHTTPAMDTDSSQALDRTQTIKPRKPRMAPDIGRRELGDPDRIQTGTTTQDLSPEELERLKRKNNLEERVAKRVMELIKEGETWDKIKKYGKKALDAIPGGENDYNRMRQRNVAKETDNSIDQLLGFLERAYVRENKKEAASAGWKLGKIIHQRGSEEQKEKYKQLTKAIRIKWGDDYMSQAPAETGGAPVRGQGAGGCPPGYRKATGTGGMGSGECVKMAPNPAPPSPPKPKGKWRKCSKNLRRGCAGDNVKQVADMLVSLGILDQNRADNKFGRSTHAAVIDFQRGKGLKDDGIVGKNTMAALQKATAGAGRSQTGDGGQGGSGSGYMERIDISKVIYDAAQGAMSDAEIDKLADHIFKNQRRQRYTPENIRKFVDQKVSRQRPQSAVRESIFDKTAVHIAPVRERFDILNKHLTKKLLK
tara:strand:- start:21566 stop:23824 length:2259 start_codon:yes stop_codon:yes gene_type:complete